MSTCGSNCSCNSGAPKTKAKCPVCGNEAVGVSFVTINNLLKAEKKALLNKDDQYFLCLDGQCKTSYFNFKGDTLFTCEDVKVPIWYKNNAAKRIACYCNNISFDQVREKVKEGVEPIWKKIVGSFRQKPICKCELLNPAGVCCTSAFYGVVNATLKELGKEPVSQEFIDQYGCC